MGPTFLPRLEQAKKFFSEQKYQQSNEICDVLLRDEFRHPDLLHLKALNSIHFKQLDEARRGLHECLSKLPTNKKAWLDLAYVYANQDDNDQALVAYQKAVDIDPTYSDAYNGIAVIYARRGDCPSAILTLQKAFAANPDDLALATNLARLLEGNSQPQESLEIYQHVIKLSPEAKNYQSLIQLYQKLNLLEPAILTCRQGLAQHPNDLALRRLLVVLEEGPITISAEVDQSVRVQLRRAFQLMQSDDMAAAEEVFVQLYQTYSYHPYLLHDYGSFCLQHKGGESVEAGLAMLDRAILTHPHFVLPYIVLSRYFMTQNQFEKAFQIAKEGIKINNKIPDLFHVLGMVLKEMGQLREAIEVMEEGMKLENANPIGMYGDLGLLYSLAGQFTKAKDYYLRASEINPDYYNAKFNYGLLLSQSGLVDESIEIFENLPSLDRNAYEALLYAAACHPEKYRQLSCYLENWSEKYASHIERKALVFSKHKKKKIRIGYVSPDFKRHPVAYFLVGPYIHHSQDDFDIYSYYNGTDIDDYTILLKEHSFEWRDVKHISDQELIEQVYKDQIDILVDLSGHTSNNRLPVFVGKPAPIQATYLGYLTTTGLQEIDYRLIDSYATPDECTEELIELPNCYLCYQPFRLDLATSRHAYEQNGHVTFGSFHRLPKIHSRLIGVWSQILVNVPSSVLLIKTRYLDAPDIQAGILDKFASNGIDADRIVFKGHADSFADHLASYDGIDVMLDTFPYNGTTITCESLWMGVPVVTLAGDRHLSRIGVSLNTNAGLDDLIGQNEEDYIRIAVKLAQDTNRLATYNTTLREQFLASPVCDPVTFTKNLEVAYQQMYRKWIDSRP